MATGFSGNRIESDEKKICVQCFFYVILPTVLTNKRSKYITQTLPYFLLAITASKRSNFMKQTLSYILLATGFSGNRIRSGKKNVHSMFLQNVILATVPTSKRSNFITKTLPYILLAMNVPTSKRTNFIKHSILYCIGYWLLWQPNKIW